MFLSLSLSLPSLLSEINKHVLRWGLKIFCWYFNLNHITLIGNCEKLRSLYIFLSKNILLFSCCSSVFLRKRFYLFLERGDGRGERERERETAISCVSHTLNPGMCPYRKSVWWPSGLQPGTQTTQPPHSVLFRCLVGYLVMNWFIPILHILAKFIPRLLPVSLLLGVFKNCICNLLFCI